MMTGKTLCFDFGNTRAKCGVFEGQAFLKEIILSAATLEEVQRVLEEESPRYAVLSSVIHHDPAIEVLLAGKTVFHNISGSSRKEVSMPFGKSDSVGADRWAMLSAGAQRFPSRHVLIVGLGSCITYNYLNCLGQFLGGSISPGLHMRFKSMNDHTALLPMVVPEWNFPLIGYDTTSNLLSGVILGMSKEIDGIIDMYKERYAHLEVLMTGGDAEFYTPHLRNQVIYDPLLVYKGIYHIGCLNFE